MKKLLAIVAGLVLSMSAIAGGMKKDLVDTAAGAGTFNTLIAPPLAILVPGNLSSNPCSL